MYMNKYRQAETKELDEQIQRVLRLNHDKENHTFDKGIFLTGGTGTGKTYALHAIKNKLVSFSGIGNSVTSVENWVELLFELKDKMGTGQMRDFLNEQITSKKFLFLDDVGAEKQTDWSQEMLYLIVNRVYERQSTLFLVTNLSLKDFTEKYGDRITSRLVEMCEVIELTGEDRRI